MEAGQRDMDYSQSKLWRTTLGASNDGPNNRLIAQLATAYRTFWDRTAEASTRISRTLPGLTLHDDRHFHALWHRADLLMPDDVELNPVEAFVFGGAVLLHDIGHTGLAYANGLDGVRATTQYRDALALIEHKAREDADPADIEKAALFEAMRVLHPECAGPMATDGLYDEHGGRIPLIEDGELRRGLGRLIGLIAESHHWPGAEVAVKLKPAGALGSMPSDWTVRSGLLAFLLRCADAIQIDGARAPSFSRRLHAPTGLSALHWDAQERLSQPMRDPERDATLKFTSTRPFNVDEAAAWWVAHDLIGTAARELREAHALMNEAGLPPLAVHKVRDADDPEALAQHVEASGWKPVRAEVKTASVERMVELFGGSQLYGHDPLVPLRELIQNASDAVRARRALEKDAGYEGRIGLSLEPDEGEEGFYWFTICDDGIGMGRSVLTGPFLEFGKSFWTSREAQREFPGLLAQKLTQTGRYGIGFFSVFMISDDLTVTSRRIRAESGPLQLRFTKDAGLRPVLLDAEYDDLGATGSTSVRLRIDQKTYDAWHTVDVGRASRELVEITLKQRVAALCPALDCEVRVDGAVAHPAAWATEPGSDWIRQIEPGLDELYSPFGQELIARCAERMELLELDGRIVGRAAIASAKFRLGAHTMGGLSTTSAVRELRESFVGALPVVPTGPQRTHHSALLSEEQLQDWATRQAVAIAAQTTDLEEHYQAALNVAEFNGDVHPLACLMGASDWRTAKDVAVTLSEGGTVCLPVQSGREGVHITCCTYSTGYHSTLILQGGEHFDTGENVFVAPDARSERSPYKSLEPTFSSFVGALHRTCEALGYVAGHVVEDRVVGVYTGKSSERDGLMTDMEIVNECAVFTATKR